MAAECSDSWLVPVSLSREQQWVVHAVLPDHVELAASAGTEPDELGCELGVLEALENGDSAFTLDELNRIRHELAAYARALDTPTRDRAVAEDLVEHLDGELTEQPA